MLEHFYAEVNNKKGEDYKPGSLKVMMASLDRRLMTLNEGSSRLQRFIQREPENAKDRHAVALTEENERIVHVGQAGTKVGPDQLGPPVRVGSTRIDSDRLGSNKKIKIK